MLARVRSAAALPHALPKIRRLRVLLLVHLGHLSLPPAHLPVGPAGLHPASAATASASAATPHLKPATTAPSRAAHHLQPYEGHHSPDGAVTNSWVRDLRSCHVREFVEEDCSGMGDFGQGSGMGVQSEEVSLETTPESTGEVHRVHVSVLGAAGRGVAAGG